MLRIPRQPVWDPMEGSSSGAIQQQASACYYLSVPSEMLSINALQRQILDPSQISMISVNHDGNTPKMLNNFPFKLH